MGYTVGDVLAERTVHVTRESLVRYAGASGDFNPIHYRDDVAASVGLPGVLAHGMLTMGIASSVVISALDPATRIVDYGVRFTKPVVVDPVDGADIHVVATVGAVDDEVARIDLKVTFDETTVLVKAQLRVTVR
jgi:acyl dehydratase